jgi:hemin uptake protein HemP
MEYTETTSAPRAREQAPLEIPRISSEELLCRARALEIEHDGKIYRLQLTRLGKLILTA